jgi:hypothetical protein
MRDHEGKSSSIGSAAGAIISGYHGTFVKICTINKVVQIHDLGIGFLKADGEGHAAAIVTDANETLLRDRPFSPFLHITILRATAASHLALVIAIALPTATGLDRPANNPADYQRDIVRFLMIVQPETTRILRINVSQSCLRDMVTFSDLSQRAFGVRTSCRNANICSTTMISLALRLAIANSI